VANCLIRLRTGSGTRRMATWIKCACRANRILVLGVAADSALLAGARRLTRSLVAGAPR
jgi:hypothetical protein